MKINPQAKIQARKDIKQELCPATTMNDNDYDNWSFGITHLFNRATFKLNRTLATIKKKRKLRKL